MIRNVSRDNAVIATQVHRCDSFLARLSGMLGKPKPGPLEAYWLIPCNSIHTLGMGYSLDVYFLSRENRVVKALTDVLKNRLTGVCFGAYSALEFACVENRNCREGDLLNIEV